MEGGGQVLRLSSALAVILGIEKLKIHSIRGKRRNPGMRPQHLKGIEAVSTFLKDGSTLIGAKLNSSEIEYTLDPSGPRKSRKNVQVNIGTAGSCTLLFQALLPCVLRASHAETSFDIQGGTDVPFSPPLDYIEHVLFPTLAENFGIDCEIIKPVIRGYYPRGGGCLRIIAKRIKTDHVLPLTKLDQGEVCELHVFVHSSSSYDEARMIAVKCSDELLSSKVILGKSKSSAPVVRMTATSDESYTCSTRSTTTLTIVAITSTMCRLGTSDLTQKSMQNRENRQQFIIDRITDIENVISSGATVDEHMADQLIIFLALASGTSRIRIPEPISLHTITAMTIASKFLNREMFGVADLFTVVCQPSQMSDVPKSEIKDIRICYPENDKVPEESSKAKYATIICQGASILFPWSHE